MEKHGPGSEPGADLGRLALLIPAWQPDGQLTALLHELQSSGFGLILVVDDGSEPPTTFVFAEAAQIKAVRVLRHARNLGKGSSLKTGFRVVWEQLPEIAGVVTADADGQHSAADIVRVAEALVSGQSSFVLGARTRLHCGSPASTRVPLRSMLGNGLTQLLFQGLYRLRLRDTQTGLRGFSRDLLPDLLTLPGARYEYEMSVLISLWRRGVRPLEIPVSTVYLQRNLSSHFRPFVDSLRVWAALIRPALSWGARSVQVTNGSHGSGTARRRNVLS